MSIIRRESKSSSIQQLILQQFGAAIDMLENSITACPDTLWDNDSRFWYIAYHALYWLDYYLSDTPMEKDYRPPAPFTTSEFGTELPERVYSKVELLTFLQHGRQRLHDRLAGIAADALLEQRWVSEYKDFSLLELLLYNMRHVQHHTGQLNLLIRQATQAPAPRWVSRARG